MCVIQLYQRNQCRESSCLFTALTAECWYSSGSSGVTLPPFRLQFQWLLWLLSIFHTMLVAFYFVFEWENRFVCFLFVSSIRKKLQQLSCCFIKTCPWGLNSLTSYERRTGNSFEQQLHWEVASLIARHWFFYCPQCPAAEFWCLMSVESSR